MELLKFLTYMKTHCQIYVLFDSYGLSKHFNSYFWKIAWVRSY